MSESSSMENRVWLSRRSNIFNRIVLIKVTMDCPACGSPVTIEVGSERPLSTSLSEVLFEADEDEPIEILRDCWDCGWHEARQIRVESIDTIEGDEADLKRAALVNEITDELAAVEKLATLEDVLAEIRRQRQHDASMTDADEEQRDDPQ